MADLPILDWRAFAALIAFGLTAGAAWLAGRASVRRPLKSFYQAVDQWRHGDLQARVEIGNTKTPLGHLSVAFNDMAGKLSLREMERENVLKMLREGEERLQIAQDVAGLGIWDWDHSTGKITWSPQMFRLTGLDRDESQDNPFKAWIGILHPDDRERMEWQVKQLPRTLEPLTSEYRIIRSDGSVRWLQMRGQSLAGKMDKPLRTVIVNLDITPSKENEVRESFLLNLSDQIRELVRPDDILMTVAEALGKHLGVTRVGYGEIDHATMMLTTLVDWRAEGMPYMAGRHPLTPFGSFVCEEMRAGRMIVIDDALSDPRVADNVDVFVALQTIGNITVSLVKEGKLRATLYLHNVTKRLWSQSEIELCRDVAERTWSAVERARSDARQRLLINELNHRVKNTLATVQSVAAHSFRIGDPNIGRAAFEARLFALSKTHDVLTRENWEGANLQDIVQEAMAPYARDNAERFRVVGEPLQLPPRIALPLAMALHELSTNAAKYGGFSTESGEVLIEWTLIRLEDGPRLVLKWTETGGPPTESPTHKGFGSRLIERGLTRELGGTVDLDYRPTGLVCTVSFPLPEAETVDYYRANEKLAGEFLPRA
ncbi:HWE histidine kinase domain-containing protein [Microvirga guangxiensis]|uniref:Blue-light-activated histidine kinase n=1 Tax=Microvirga guangxiensis TaxID=549386 RepID=A0A1G5EU97_9HYPH|nr:HWE histidine kinase domain-containing protein [Microvirga guangxiensis]SCY30575.1 GAF domain-containing protein [Microvirga guangxiensis]